MGGKEREFSERTRRALKGAGCRCYPVETGGTATGFPDIVVVGQGGASFVELKSRLSMPLASVVSAPLEGQGQKAFARGLVRRSAFTRGQVVVTSHSFLLVECMDGVVLLVEEGKGTHPAASWEGMPSGVDLRDAIRAWRVRCSPSRELEGCTEAEALAICSREYSIVTGIPLERGQARDGTLADSGGALEIGRLVCDMGRISLLMKSMKENEAGLVPIEGGNGYVIVKGE